MPLETGNEISDLNPLWPLGTDPKSQGDDHLRLIKGVMQNDIVPKSTGGTFAGQVIFAGNGKLNDGAKMLFGTDNDGEILHDGTNMRVTNKTGTMSLNADTIQMRNAGISANIALLTTDLADIYPVINARAGLRMGSSIKARFGPSYEMEIFRDSANGYIINPTGEFRIRSDVFRLQSADGSKTAMIVDANAGGGLYYSNVLKLSTTSTGINIAGTASGTGGYEVNNGSTSRMKIQAGGTTSYSRSILNAGGAFVVNAEVINMTGTNIDSINWNANGQSAILNYTTATDLPTNTTVVTRQRGDARYISSKTVAAPAPLTINGSRVVNHGLSAANIISVQHQYVCQVAEHGYAVGDRITDTTYEHNLSTAEGATVWYGATQVGYAIRTRLTIIPKNGASNGATATPGSWAVEFVITYRN